MTTPNTVIASTYGPILTSTKTKADDVLNAAAAAGHRVIRVYGYNSVPDHNNLKCVDFMGTNGVSAVNTTMMNWVAQYAINNANRLGICGIIWNRRVMGFPANGTAYRGPSGTWRTYFGASPHTDHVHIEFNTSAIVGGSTNTGSNTGSNTGDTSNTKPIITTPKGVPIVATPKKMRRSKAFTLKQRSTYQSVPLTDTGETYSILTGPGDMFIVANIRPDKNTWARFVTVNYKKGSATKIVSRGQRVRIPAGGGQITMYDTIGSAPAGWSRRVRLQLLAYSNDVPVSDIRIRAGKEK